MEIITDINSFNLTKSVATIGIFDGVHTAHQAIIKHVKHQANIYHSPSVMITLWPHPRKVLYPDKPLQLLTTLNEKCEQVAKTGIDYMVVLPFTSELANTNYQDFIKQYIFESIHAKYVLIGYNHHFGKNREGSYESLKLLGEKFNFIAERLDPFHVGQMKVSSSLIRRHLLEGNVVIARKLLGYPYFINGTVVKGKQLGKKMGFPTANLKIKSDNKLIPAIGVYAAFVQVKQHTKALPAMLNIGHRPTVNDQEHQVTIEVNIFDFNQDIYNTELRINFIDRIRDEKKFENLQALINQLQADKIRAREILQQAYPDGFIAE